MAQERFAKLLEDSAKLRAGRRRTSRSLPNGQASRVETGKWRLRLEEAHGVEGLIRKWAPRPHMFLTEISQDSDPSQAARPIATASIKDMVFAQAGLEL